jgi:acyl-CoA synthetase (AMP-forming)/AMP-acid ligase II
MRSRYIMSDRPLLAWLDDPVNDRGIRFARRGEGWDVWTYLQLAHFARQVTWGLVEAGVRENDVVSIVKRSGPSFVATLFGAMLAGAIPSPVAPPIALQDPMVYRDHVTGLLRSARPSIVVTDTNLIGGIRELAVKAGVPNTSTVDALIAGVDEKEHAPTRALAELALLQFTSGSSGRARGVGVPFHALQTNVQAIRRWLHWTESDPVASWLPVHHDMGLIGCLITPDESPTDIGLNSRDKDF